MKTNYYIVILLLLLWGCANKVLPTGGPQDEDPPVLISSSPNHGQKNFKDQEMFIEFNEYIAVKNLKDQLIITPRINGEYDYRIRKRTIFIDFDEPFQDSTTFTLNFREGLVDITEGNPAQDMQIAFSTGNILDTLEITGHVMDLMTKNPIDGATIGIYHIDDTLDIFSGPPYYFTKTDKAGDYIFRNIKDGTYRLYAFIDNNKNLTCQSYNEAYGFMSNTIQLDSAFVADTLNLQFLNIDTLKMTRARPSGRYFIVSANKYLTYAALRADNDSTIIFKYEDDHNGLKVYNTFPIKDSLKVFATLQDSLGIIVQDTFYLNFPETTRKEDEFKVAFKDPEGSQLKKLISGKLIFDKPLLHIWLDSVSIKKDSLEQYLITESFTYVFDTLNNTLEYTIKIPQAILDSLELQQENRANTTVKGSGKIGAKSVFTLSFTKGSFISVENDSSKASNKKIKFIDLKQTGLINGRITTLNNSFIIQLLDSKFDIVKEQINGASYQFNEINPDEYYIRILIDDNENGTWDLADIRQNKQAEQVIIYKDAEGNSKTAIRANWEVTIDLSF